MASKKLKINEINVLDMLSDDSDSSGESDIDESDIDKAYIPSSSSSSDGSEGSHSEADSSDDEIENGEEEETQMASELPRTSSNEQVEAEVLRPAVDDFSWSMNFDRFQPRMNLPPDVEPTVLVDANRSTSELGIFLQLFTTELFEKISTYTNMRLQLLRSEKPNGENIHDTTAEEIMVVLGCILVMSYNKVPAMHMLWSNKKSLGNPEIKEAISRDRFQIIFSKLYFQNPEKPENATKTYYLEEVLASLKSSFTAARSDSIYQSIDESMTKFKGRSALKQYMPMKPIKRGIKLWTRCDANTGYVYDTNIYTGKETDQVEGTLGERVVKTLADSVRNPNVVLVFDRYFTSVKLLCDVPYPAVGTYMKRRRNVPLLQANLTTRGESEMAVCSQGILGIHWKDTKDVYLMSNCHKPTITTTTRKQKDGTKQEVSCPEAIAFYNKHMGGVDHADQMITLYDLDRKNKKWWRKVFFRLLLTAVYISFVIFCYVRHKKISYISFFVNVAETLIDFGRDGVPKKRTRRVGRHSLTSRMVQNVGDHLPIKEKKRRRCIRCKSVAKKEKRTSYVCKRCNVPLCMDCFTPHHT